MSTSAEPRSAPPYRSGVPQQDEKPPLPSPGRRPCTADAALTRNYLRCEAYHADHPACLLQAKQRKSKAKRRICMARKGNVGLCKDTELPWSLLVSTAEKRARSKISTPTSAMLTKRHSQPYVPWSSSGIMTKRPKQIQTDRNRPY